MFKPLTAQLSEKVGGSVMTPTLDPAQVARSFGVTYEVGESLPESITPIKHVEDERDSGLQFDHRKNAKATERTMPQSLCEIASTRLQSIKPRTKERAKQVAMVMAEMLQPLAQIDIMFNILLEERNEAISVRLEELRERGRELRDRLNDELQAAVYSAMMAINETERTKVHAQTTLDTRITQRRALRLDRYSTEAQLLKADERIASAVNKLNEAKEAQLVAMQAKDAADNALALGRSEFRGIEIAMDQCHAELQGAVYHDPNLGLSVDPTSHLQ
jgi:hypothetical protein